MNLELSINIITVRTINSDEIAYRETMSLVNGPLPTNCEGLILQGMSKCFAGKAEMLTVTLCSKAVTLRISQHQNCYIN